MKIKTRYYSFEIDDKDGSLVKFSNLQKDLIINCKKNSLFKICLRDSAGKPVVIDSNSSKEIRISRQNSDDSIIVKILFKNIDNQKINAEAVILISENHFLSYWDLALENKTKMNIEWIEYPLITIPNDLKGSGGENLLFWPAMEGCLIENAEIRDNTWLKYQSPGYPSKGYEGFYPGPCPMQFMACYGPKGGLYIAAHDASCQVKYIEYYLEKGSIRIENKLFPGGIDYGTYRMPYKMAIGVFEGDWYDAADIYREWLYKSLLIKSPKIKNNPFYPDWINDSPVILTYPIRGSKDTGQMQLNEYFPYTNALPQINRISKDLTSRLLVLLMHWEGTAPWAPPYVFPPFGGIEKLKEYILELHKNENLLGLYCSGIAWTNQSWLIKEYNKEQEFYENELIDVMCAAPDGSIPNSSICNGPIRSGYDMCPECDFVEKTVLTEIEKILDLEIDYLQYFDQNLGGTSYLCYSKNHGHSPAPGYWQVSAMKDLFSKINKLCQNYKNKMVIGCESAAAEPYIPYLLLNDLRYQINFFYAKPVPAYSYLFHEFINNFMGNQNCSSKAIDINKSPESFLFRLAYSFIAGDLLTIVMKDGGKIHWDWGTEWEVEEPEQESAMAFLKKLNSLRKIAAKQFLIYGKMLKPYQVNNAQEIKIYRNDGSFIVYPSVLSSRWVSSENRLVQVMVNYAIHDQNIEILLPDKEQKTAKIYDDPFSEFFRSFEIREKICVSIKALSPVMIEFTEY